MPRRNEKRRRVGDDRRPNPPPPPPPSLVRLIQKDASVLEYFQALQTNLDFDVKKWKTRARELEEERESLRKELTATTQLQQQSIQNVATSKFSEGRSTSETPQNKPNDSETVHVAYQTVVDAGIQGEPRHHQDFELEFSSSSSQSDEDLLKPPKNLHEPKPSFGIYRKNSTLNLSSSEDEGDEWNIPDHVAKTVQEQRQKQRSPDIQIAIDQLLKVSEILDDLGIPLLEKKSLESTNLSTTESDGETNESLLPTRCIFRRRSNRDVAIDILLFIKALTRIKHVSCHTKAAVQQSYFYPFMTDDCLPCYTPLGASLLQLVTDPPTVEHPAVRGVEQLLICLCSMDVFCPALDRMSLSPETVLETLEESCNSDTDEHGDRKLRRLLFEMKDRQALISCLLQSTEGEIIDTWGAQDRSTRLLTKATHLLTETDPEKVDSDSDGERMSAHEAQAIPFNAKNFVRISALMERCILAKMVTTLHLCRQDYHKAFQVFWGYITSTAPALNMEEYPKLPPVQSFCVLEAILKSSPPTIVGISSTYQAATTLLNWMEGKVILKSQKCQHFLCLALELTARIYRLRNASNLDDRITDMSRVELAAYDRITKCGFFSQYSEEVRTQTLVKELELILADDGSDQETSTIVSLSLLLNGDATKVDEEFQNVLFKIRNNQSKTSNPTSFHRLDTYRLLAFVAAKKQLEIRRLEDYRRIVQTPMIIEPNHTGLRHVQSYSKMFIDWLVTQELDEVYPMVVTGFRCCQNTANGESVFRLADWTIKQLQTYPGIKSTLFPILCALESMSDTLTIRIINLNRRPDRLAAFLSQILHERVNILQGVASLNAVFCDFDHNLVDGYYFGNHAIDGQGKAADVERRLVDLVGGRQEDLNKLVETHWVPNELKPFDNDAPDCDRMVLISASEKACAISHIACWKGVERSLATGKPGSNVSILRDPVLMRQRFLISGFARGESLFQRDMDPSPVCVILEDDAILVDRFADRLAILLEELPRDFHFCSLGYSRPKTAPLVPFSSELSIPTSIWYLTGYVLSLEGARFLLNKLPVRGPIDSWIGLAMFSNNWDNVFGHALGVGVSSKPPQDPTVSKVNLRKILRFRAFAASVPLCSQKVGNIASLPSTGRNWRQRDTDIVYSGNSL